MVEVFLPKLRVKSIYDIPLDELYAQGIRGLITDLDNTLVGAKAPLATDELVKWLATVKQRGIDVVIVSNNNDSRVGAFAAPLGLRYIHAARKPAQRAFRRALELLQLEASQTLMVGDQLMTDVLGGNRMGLHTVLVAPISPNDEGFMTKVNRRMERIAIAKLRKRGLWQEEE
ncbi:MULTISPECIES: YqeG family HAD IIIA-type phosphatase [Paenibacillus]|uniref:YqeG family HAD IIIA-type phosphatase n=1 Tax=Paenibacillus TaxID=44249 RepID=UPI00203F9713|nr:YqeG family HAD IIIA-type phosphatase [Paenibacillus camelliae]MCM3632314.1 YqeG family HAD IIIA-type phosphatase [Paenibacillus camelliae]